MRRDGGCAGASGGGAVTGLGLAPGRQAVLMLLLLLFSHPWARAVPAGGQHARQPGTNMAPTEASM